MTYLHFLFYGELKRHISTFFLKFTSRELVPEVVYECVLMSTYRGLDI